MTGAIEPATGDGQPALAVDVDELIRFICRSCVDLLNRAAVTPEDNFFGLGGDSLTAVELLEMIAETHRVDVPMGLVFESSTLGEFAHVVAGLVSEQEAQRST